MAQEVIGEEPVQAESQEEQQSQSVELDLEKFGNMEIQQGGSKPTFDKVTEAKIVAATLRTTPDRVEKATKAGEKQVFYPVFLQVEMEYNDGSETKKAYERYGSGRLFISETDQTKRFWVGNNSALGHLVRLLEDNFDFKGTLKEIPELILNKKVGIKTEKGEVGGNEYQKNVIKVFYK